MRKFASILLAAVLSASLLTGCEGSGQSGQQPVKEALSAGADSTTDLFVPLTEKTSKSLVFPLTEEQAALVEKAGADKVTWTLHRLAPYANPADGNFIPLHGEEKMFPNEKEMIGFATIRFSS